MNKRVGSPLAKDFIHKIEQGILKSSSDSDAETILKFGNMCSYWKNNMKRIWLAAAIHFIILWFACFTDKGVSW